MDSTMCAFGLGLVGSQSRRSNTSRIIHTAARARIQTMREERLLTNAERMGMVATEFTSAKNELWAERAKAATHAALKEGLMLLTCGAY